MQGSTAGVVERRGQPVFASSTPPRSSKATTRKGKAHSPAKRSAPAASERSVPADLWSGVSSAGANPSLASAAAASGKSGGLGGGVVAAIAVLALGLAGITGGALVTAERRRRAAADVGAPRY